MKLSEWAKRNGISYKTAWRWIKQGRFPVPYEQTPSGTILVRDTHDEDGIVAIYAILRPSVWPPLGEEHKAKKALEEIQCEN